MEDKEVQGPPEGSGDTQGTTTVILSPPKEGGTQVEEVGQRASLDTQAKGLCGDRSMFKEGKQVEMKVNQRRAGGRGLEAQDRQEEKREGDRTQKGGKERGTGLSKGTEDSGSNTKENS